MADDSRDEPVLVRPYITTAPGGHDDRPAQTWPAQTWPAEADRPEDGTRELPAVTGPVVVPAPPSKRGVRRRQRLLILAVVGALAGLGGTGLLLLRPDDPEPPVTALPVPAAPPATGAPAAAPVASAGVRSASPSARATTVVASAAASATGRATGVPATVTSAPSATTPSATGVPPPGTARTGPVTAAGGRCLSLGGLLGLDNSPVQTARCSGVSAQRWTLETDGTLRVAGKCAQAGTTVRVTGCDDGAAGQWRAGPGGSLVNPATGRCLTDPGTVLTAVSATTCTGADDQRWTLP